MISASHFAQEDDRYELSSINFVQFNETFDDSELKTIIQSEENHAGYGSFCNTSSFSQDLRLIL